MSFVPWGRMASCARVVNPRKLAPDRHSRKEA
jgi:hypothetical protein